MTNKTPVFCVTTVMEDNSEPYFNLLTQEELAAYNAAGASDVMASLIAIPHYLGKDVDEHDGNPDKLTHGSIKGAARLIAYLEENNLQITEETGAISY